LLQPRAMQQCSSTHMQHMHETYWLLHVPGLPVWLSSCYTVHKRDQSACCHPQHHTLAGYACQRVWLSRHSIPNDRTPTPVGVFTC
jgi:hypothetical protein